MARSSSQIAPHAPRVAVFLRVRIKVTKDANPEMIVCLGLLLLSGERDVGWNVFASTNKVYLQGGQRCSYTWICFKLASLGPDGEAAAAAQSWTHATQFT